MGSANTLKYVIKFLVFYVMRKSQDTERFPWWLIWTFNDFISPLSKTISVHCDSTQETRSLILFMWLPVSEICFSSSFKSLLTIEFIYSFNFKRIFSSLSLIWAIKRSNCLSILLNIDSKRDGENETHIF